MKQRRSANLIRKHPVDPARIRKRPRQFACLDRSLVYHKHICRMTHPQIALYVFLECVSDPQGLSYYSDKRIRQYLHLDLDQFHQARSALINKQLILYSCPLYQILDMPPVPNPPPASSTRSLAPLPKHSSEEAVPVSNVIKSIMEEFSHAST